MDETEEEQQQPEPETITQVENYSEIIFENFYFLASIINW